MSTDRRNVVEVIQWGNDDYGWHRLDNGQVVADSAEGYSHLSHALERAQQEADAHQVELVYSSELEPEEEGEDDAG